MKLAANKYNKTNENKKVMEINQIEKRGSTVSVKVDFMFFSIIKRYPNFLL